MGFGESTRFTPREVKRLAELPVLDLSDPRLQKTAVIGEGATYIARLGLLDGYIAPTHVKVLAKAEALARMGKRKQLLADDRLFNPYLASWAQLMTVKGHPDLLAIASFDLTASGAEQLIEANTYDRRSRPPLFTAAALWLRKYQEESRSSEYGTLMRQDFESEVQTLLSLLNHHSWEADPDTFAIGVEKTSDPLWPYRRNIYMLDLGIGLRKLPPGSRPNNSFSQVWDMVQATY